MLPLGHDKVLFLDMVGGIAGDMFIAATGDLHPELESICHQCIGSIKDLPRNISARFFDHSSTGRFGRRFSVDEDKSSNDGIHRRHVGFQTAIQIVRATDMSKSAQNIAEHIFEILARSEGHIHNVPYESVVFHEIGGWDSIVDIILSARVIVELGDIRWLCGPIPLGRGSIDSEHGLLPLPAPATVDLLRGFNVYQDSFSGERVTPTGAAILRHLQPEQLPALPLAKLNSCGTGYGSKEFDGLSNILRIYSLSNTQDFSQDSIAVVEFDIDDQSPEDLSIGLDGIRSCGGVLDVVQQPFYGKKGRLGIHVRILAEWDKLYDTIAASLSATSSIGVRWQRVDRAVLARKSETITIDDRSTSIKLVERPDSQVTGKIEADDLKPLRASYGRRENIRHVARRFVGEQQPGDSDGDK